MKHLLSKESILSTQELKNSVFTSLNFGTYEDRKNTIESLKLYFSNDEFDIKNFANIYGASGKITFEKLIETRPVSFKKCYKNLTKKNTSLFALNIYDIRPDSSDISSLLENAIKFNSPCIAQVSLNAAYGLCDSETYNLSPGYLKLNNGAIDFINTVLDEAVKARFTISDQNTLLYGIGLDHVGGKYDQASLSANHFLNQALNTQNLTHATLDGSHLVKKLNHQINMMKQLNIY